MEVTWNKANGLLQWWKVYLLYRNVFPASERKPFMVILKMAQQKRTDVWCLYDKSRFVGFVTTINGTATVLLDYLAVKPAFRGQGVGRAALSLMGEQYRGKGLFVEIESPFEPGSDQAMRKRRKQFYRSCGMEPFGVMVNVFGVKMELLGYGCKLNFEEYYAFYRDNYSPWAAEPLSEERYIRNEKSPFIVG